MKLTSKMENQIYILLIETPDDYITSLQATEIYENIKTSILNKKLNGILINCSNIHYISSPVMGVFFQILKDFSQRNIQLALCCMSKKSRTSAETLGYDKMIPIFDTEQDVVKFFNSNHSENTTDSI